MSAAETRKPGRPRDPQLEARRKAQILDTAAKVFAGVGFAATDVQAIADRIGVGKGTVYRYFATKEVLFLAAVERGLAELTAEMGIGITAKKSSGPTGPMMFKIPLSQHSVFDNVIEKQSLFYEHCSDPVLDNHLYSNISAPHSPRILMLPLVVSGKVIALIYADFGQLMPNPVLIEHLEILARVAGLVLDNTYNRKRIERLIQPHQGRSDA